MPHLRTDYRYVLSREELEEYLAEACMQTLETLKRPLTAAAWRAVDIAVRGALQRLEDQAVRDTPHPSR